MAVVLLLAWLNSDRTFFDVDAVFLDPAFVRSWGRIAVVDGDTIRVGGKLTRLVGFNAPETWKPGCFAERELGDLATRRLRDLVANGPVEFARLRCACPPGTEGSAACNYGRACGILRANARNVGDILIAEGLAVRYACGATGCRPPPRPWCGG